MRNKSLAFKSIFILSIALFHNQASATGRGRFLSPAAGLCSVVTVHGFKCQEYSVETKDGYILGIQRIPAGRAGGDGGRPRQPVLLQHGLTVDGMTWLLNSPEQSLAMMLADSGYDVWISNTRGTRFSRRHVILDPILPEFWNWTWVELANNELPCVIDFVFGQSGQQIHYVGHSMGTLVALVSLSEGKFEKVKSAALLSPIAYISHMTSQVGIVGARSFLAEVGKSIGVAEFDPNGPEAVHLLQILCTAMDCDDLTTLICGQNCCLNETTLDNFLQNGNPQPTAIKNLVHFAQNVRNGVLSKFDFGNKYVNMLHYGAPEPPVYDLSKIPPDFPLFISYGGQDALSDVKDVRILLDNLKTHDKDKMEVQYIQQYAHADFIMAVNANDLVYKHIIDFFGKHN